MDLQGIHLYRSWLTGSRFDNASLVNANLSRADASDVSAIGATFERAWLIDTEFTDADLRWASFRRARLTATGFVGADCQGANFESADLDTVSFWNAKFGTGWPSSFIDANGTVQGIHDAVGPAEDVISPGRFVSGVNAHGARLSLFDPDAPRVPVPWRWGPSKWDA